MLQYTNEIKEKSHIIISADAGKAFEEVQHPFMINTLRKLGLEEKYLNIIKAIYEKLIAKIFFNGENLKAFPISLGQDKDVHPHHFFIQHSTRTPSHSN